MLHFFVPTLKLPIMMHGKNENDHTVSSQGSFRWHQILLCLKTIKIGNEPNLLKEKIKDILA